jgi:hypothetical protein
MIHTAAAWTSFHGLLRPDRLEESCYAHQERACTVPAIETMSVYRTQSLDTSVEAERILIDRYRRMTPAEKLDIARALTKAAHELALAGARLRHPGATDDELRLHVAACRLSPEIMAAAFGWSPDRR